MGYELDFSSQRSIQKDRSVYLHVYVCVDKYKHEHIFMQVCMNTKHVYIYIYIHMYTYICMYVCTYVYMYIHIHTCLHGAFQLKCSMAAPAGGMPMSPQPGPGPSASPLPGPGQAR